MSGEISILLVGIRCEDLVDFEVGKKAFNIEATPGAGQRKR